MPSFSYSSCGSGRGDVRRVYPHVRIRPAEREGGGNLLELEDVVVEVLLQLLVGVVDAKLFEAVDIEVLESEYVQHSDERRLCLGRSSYGLPSSPLRSAGPHEGDGGGSPC